MPPKPDSPIEPFKRAVAATMRATALSLATWVTISSTANACLLGRPSPESVQFSNWVAEASEITLAQVIAAKALPASAEPSIYDDTHQFTFRPIERIKGNSLPEFTLNGTMYRSDGYTKQIISDHEGVGTFWTLFHPTCSWEFPYAFALNESVLLFRDGKGKLMSYRNLLDVIPTKNDAWLSAVRTLARNPSLTKGRKAPIADFLISSRAIVVTATLKCGRQHILKQLWGTPITLEELAQLRAHDWLSSECTPGRRRLVIAHIGNNPDDRGILQLKVSGENTVDFTGFLNGTGDGIVRVNNITTDLWFSQIEFEGRHVWKLTELETFLHSAAANQSARGR